MPKAILEMHDLQKILFLAYWKPWRLELRSLEIRKESEHLEQQEVGWLKTATFPFSLHKFILFDIFRWVIIETWWSNRQCWVGCVLIKSNQIMPFLILFSRVEFCLDDWSITRDGDWSHLLGRALVWIY